MNLSFALAATNVIKVKHLSGKVLNEHGCSRRRVPAYQMRRFSFVPVSCTA
jgi:hypothetical protein